MFFDDSNICELGLTKLAIVCCFSTLLFAAKQQPVKLSLNDALILAFKQSPILKKEEQLLESANSRVNASRSSFFPELSIEATTGTYSDRSPIPGRDPANPAVAREYNQYNGQLVLKQNLFAGFESISKFRLAESQREEKRTELFKTQNDIALNVIELYFSIQLDQAKLAAENEIAKLRKEQFDEIKNRNQTGRATDLELLQAQYALKSQEPKITTMQMEASQKTLSLMRYLGIDLNAELVLTDTLENAYAVSTKEQIPELDELYERALKENHELALAQQKVLSKNLEMNAQMAKYLPKVDFSLQGGTHSYLREELSSTDARDYAILLHVTVPLFSGFESIYERQELASESQALTYDETVKRESIFEQLLQYRQQLRIADATLASEKIDIDLSSETVKKAETLHRIGAAKLSELLESYSQKQTAMENYSDAMLKRLQATIRIKYLLGRLSS